MTAPSRPSDAAQYSCSACGQGVARWVGRCPSCGAWGTVGERAGAGAVTVSTLARAAAAPERFSTGLPEVDRVLGGGVVPGAVVLLSGEPGIGKSTLVLQLLDGAARGGRRALLVTGEESLDQVALRAARLSVDAGALRAIATTALEDVVAAAAEERPDVVVVDSVQTLAAGDLDGAPGAVAQVRECAARLVRHAKATGAAVVLVGHVTKDGGVAGPKTLEHVVDVVVSLDGERGGVVRLLRAAKNRFGSCDETGVFVMGATGLEPVPDPSAMLLADRRAGVPGSVVFPGLEGTRPVLVELQALVAPTPVVQPRRVAIGLDGRRVALLLGVLARRAGVSLASHDVFVAAAGGLDVREPAGDLGVALALASAAGDAPLDDDAVAFGEIGLAGEIRRVPGMERRLAEAARLGFRRALAPCGASAPPGIDVVEVRDLAEALERSGRAPAGVG
ncbi:MAG TPA: DNA repair protein RadA [Actinomycetota bacterium]|nr:DNA repair protein RadA [Actinomycetota bacterium]